MAVMQRNELEGSPLADLHAIASELGIESYRRLPHAELIDAIVAAQGEPAGADAGPPAAEAALAEEEDEEEQEEREEEEGVEEEDVRSGVLDILPNGSGFMRAEPFAHSPDDVYVSPGQVRRCELRSGDELSGPVRPPRRSERYPSLVRVASVNGTAPEPPAERPRFEDLTPVFPSERLTAPDALAPTPFGKGSRVAVAGPPAAGATTLLREIARTLAERHPEVELTVVLAGVRPEEVTEWRRSLEGTAVAGGGFDRSLEEQAQIADLATERGKRVAERGGSAAIVVDALDALPPATARRVFGAARRAEEGGSLTVVAATGADTALQRAATCHVTLEPAPEAGPPQVGGVTLHPELLQ